MNVQVNKQRTHVYAIFTNEDLQNYGVTITEIVQMLTTKDQEFISVQRDIIYDVLSYVDFAIDVNYLTKLYVTEDSLHLSLAKYELPIQDNDLKVLTADDFLGNNPEGFEVVEVNLRDFTNSNEGSVLDLLRSIFGDAIRPIGVPTGGVHFGGGRCKCCSGYIVKPELLVAECDNIDDLIKFSKVATINEKDDINIYCKDSNFIIVIKINTIDRKTEAVVYEFFKNIGLDVKTYEAYLQEHYTYFGNKDVLNKLKTL